MTGVSVEVVWSLDMGGVTHRVLMWKFQTLRHNHLENLKSVPNGTGEILMSIGWICNSDYYDGVHKVKHKLTDEESFVYVGEALIHDDEFYMVLDCKTDKVINNDEYDHLAYYEDGRYFECSEHEGEWLFDDGDGYYDECPKCKELEDELLSFKVAEDVYQYNSSREFNRLKYLLKADKYRDWKSNSDVKPQQGLFILITEYSAEWGETDYYYKTIEKSFIDGLEWS